MTSARTTWRVFPCSDTGWIITGTEDYERFAVFVVCAFCHSITTEPWCALRVLGKPDDELSRRDDTAEKRFTH